MVKYYKEGIWYSGGNSTIGTETTMCLLWVEDEIPVGCPREFDAEGFFHNK